MESKMIEKLKTPKHINWDDTPEAMLERHWIITDVYEKVNQLIETVNALIKENNIHEKQIDELQMKLEPEKCEIPVDPFAEQRKWIGCVCRFWYDNPDNTTLDYLGKIQTGENGIEYYGKETYDWFPHCEPILPTDNAIYKGGDNE